jgi:hypothetical protein
MRHISALLLTLVLIWQSLGYFSYFEISKMKISNEVKTYIKNGVPKDQLIPFTFTVQEYQNIQWIKPLKEFKYKQHLYDVVDKKSENGQIILSCLSDVKETNLFQNLDQIVSKKLADPNNSSHTFQIFQITHIPFIPIQTLNIQLDNIFCRTNTFLSTYHFSIQTGEEKVPDTPPQV